MIEIIEMRGPLTKYVLETDYGDDNGLQRIWEGNLTSEEARKVMVDAWHTHRLLYRIDFDIFPMIENDEPYMLVILTYNDQWENQEVDKVARETIARYVRELFIQAAQ